MNKDAIKKNPARPKTTTRVIISVLVILYLIAMWIVFYGTPRSNGYILYYLNAHHWPWWYGLNLWIVAVGSVLVCFARRKQRLCLIYATTFFALIVVTILFANPFHPFFVRVYHRLVIQLGIFYRTVILSYFYAPITDFFTDGTLSGRLFIVPIGAIMLIVLLLRWNCRIKRQTKENRIKE